MTAITDYATLLTGVASHIDRTDLATEFPRFVQLSETVMKRQLRTLDMETTLEQALVAEDDAFDLPADFLSLRAIYLVGDTDEDEPNLPLEAYSSAAYAQRFTGLAGVPTGYVRIANTIQLAPAPEEAVTVKLIYLAKFTPLTSVATNWIITNHPDIYFYGTLAQAMAWDENENAGTYAALFASAIQDLKTSRAMDRWGPGMAIPSPVRQITGARC